MRFVGYDIVFQEIPDEVTLAINISNCPNRCIGCHSPYLQEDTGDILDEKTIEVFLKKYGDAITCICFMGGDGSPDEVLRLAKFTKQFHKKTAWYSGKSELYKNAILYFDYIKLGEYIKELGGLNSPTTNQRLYKIEGEKIIDVTRVSIITKTKLFI